MKLTSQRSVLSFANIYNTQTETDGVVYDQHESVKSTFRNRLQGISRTMSSGIMSMSSQTSSKKTKTPRLLAIHGWKSNNDVSRQQCKNLGLSEVFEITYLHGPIESSTPGDETLTAAFHGPWYSWLDDFNMETSGMEAKKFALETSIKYILDHIKASGSYDAVYGFSQGAAMVSMLSDSSVLHQYGFEDTPWDIVICCSAAGETSILKTGSELINTPSFKSYYPSCHIIGTRDFKKSESEKIMNIFDSANPFNLYLECGHEVTLTAMRSSGGYQEVRNWLRQYLPLKEADADSIRYQLASGDLPDNDFSLSHLDVYSEMKDMDLRVSHRESS
jgi:hypothetical protein